MTPDEIEAERERCFDWIAEDGRHADAYDIWLARAAIARAQQAELLAEIERLRERVRELAKGKLLYWLRWQPYLANVAWEQRSAEIDQLAEEAGVWFDDDDNVVPLHEWRARMGGAG